jgi:hypothetical protein
MSCVRSSSAPHGPQWADWLELLVPVIVLAPAAMVVAAANSVNNARPGQTARLWDEIASDAVGSGAGRRSDIVGLSIDLAIAPLTCRVVVCHTASAASGSRATSSTGSANREDATRRCSSPAHPEWPIAPAGWSAALRPLAALFRVAPPDSYCGRPRPEAPPWHPRSAGPAQVCVLSNLFRAAPWRAPLPVPRGQGGSTPFGTGRLVVFCCDLSSQ